MAIRYDPWLQATGRKGTADDALAWKKTHGVALGLYTPDGQRVSAPTVAAAPSAPPAVQQNPATAPLITNYQTQLSNVPAKYDPLRASAQASFTAANKPYSTGQAARDTTRSVRQGAAARGMLYSSYADRDLGAALGRLNDQSAAIYNQYSRELTQIANSEQEERTGIGTKLVELFGQNAAWALENPPPAPPSAVAAPAPAGAQPQATGGAKRPDGLFTAAGFANWLRGAGRPVPTGAKFRDLYWGYLSKHGAQPQ